MNEVMGLAKRKMLFYIAGFWMLLFLGMGAVWAAKDPRADGGLVVHLFYSSACSSCHEALVVVAKARSLCPRLEVRYHNLIYPGKVRLKQAFCTYYRVPPD
ncbi:MAG: hypothetical protein K6U03_01510, partial [Firmicutes bacterium]|nr:hypothetical protein [Bacillota bacterium]